MNLSASTRADVASSLRYAADEAMRNSSWVVVVCPDGSDFLTTFQNSAGGLLPTGTSVAGRTALLPTGGRISVVAVGDDPFIPAGTPFSVMFCGWGDDIAADNRRMQLWRAGASRVIR